MTAPHQLRPVDIARRAASSGTNAGAFPHVFSSDAASSLSDDHPARDGGSLYLSAAGVTPVRIWMVRHHLHRRALHVMKTAAAAEAPFTYTDFVHFAPAPVAVLPLAGLSATLDPAISLVEQLHA